MSIKYLSSAGLTEVWSNIKAYIASKIPSKIITGLSIKGRTITYTNSDGTTGTLTTQDTNTTYASMSATEATTGTETTARSISAKVLHDKITSITNTKANNSDVVHKSGTETIVGTKTFSNVIYSNKELAYKDTKYDWTDTSLNTWCDAGHVSWSDKTNNRRMHELVGTKGGVWQKACYINEQPYFAVNSNRDITYWGTTTFYGNICACNDFFQKNTTMDATVTPSSSIYSNYIFKDKNEKILGYMQYCHQYKGIHSIGLFLHGSSNNLYGVIFNNAKQFYPLEDNTHSLGTSTRKWANVYATRINCDNIVKTVEDSYVYMTAGPSWNSGASVFLNGKSGDGLNTGKGTFLLFARDGTNERRLLGYPTGILSWNGYIQSHEVRSTGVNAFMAQYGSYTFLIRNDGSNTYLLMSDKDGTPGTWSTARPLTINNATGVCSINGHADSANYANSATYATTQATTDNSTKIATTAWVRTYVNSAVGSGSVGTTITAYYSNATTVTATGGNSINSSYGPGVYPSAYSDYINIAPTVGTIYTGSQLFSSFTPTASGTIDKNSTGPSSSLYQTSAKATATFSGAFSASAKYLCTTANAVKFRAYVSQGTSNAMGTASVVDKSSTKSIFIRVQ